MLTSLTYACPKSYRSRTGRCLQQSIIDCECFKFLNFSKYQIFYYVKKWLSPLNDLFLVDHDFMSFVECKKKLHIYNQYLANIIFVCLIRAIHTYMYVSIFRQSAVGKLLCTLCSLVMWPAILSRRGHCERHSVETIHTSILHATYTANFYPMKTTGTGNYGVPAGKTCTIYGKGL